MSDETARTEPPGQAGEIGHTAIPQEVRQQMFSDLIDIDCQLSAAYVHRDNLYTALEDVQNRLRNANAVIMRLSTQFRIKLDEIAM